MKTRKVLFAFGLCVTLVGFLSCCATYAAHGGEPKDLPILERWSGDYPVAQLDRLPEGQRKSRVGYLGDAKILAAVWQAFKPDEKSPEVDFSTHLVVFSRNVDFYNRTSIAKVTLKDGVAEVIAIETMSAMPIEERVAISLAVIPREGVKFIQAGDERVPVTKKESGADPMNVIYTIERQEVGLVNGRSKVEAAPGSTTRIKTRVFGNPVYGGLDGDRDDDATLFLVHDPGGSGTFYYVAAAINVSGTYHGTKGDVLQRSWFRYGREETARASISLWIHRIRARLSPHP